MADNTTTPSLDDYPFIRKVASIWMADRGAPKGIRLDLKARSHCVEAIVSKDGRSESTLLHNFLETDGAVVFPARYIRNHLDYLAEKLTR